MRASQNVRGRVIRPAIITRAQVRAQATSALFVYGDNMEREGMGGQAGAMRGEPNSIGVPTKWTPGMAAADFFTDADWTNSYVRHAILDAFNRMGEAMAQGRDVVIPADGLGTGLAELPKRAPMIFAHIERMIGVLEATAG